MATGSGFPSNVTAGFHVITAFTSLVLLNMLNKTFCHVLTESVALIIHDAIIPRPPYLVLPPHCLDLLLNILLPARAFLSLSHMWAW